MLKRFVCFLFFLLISALWVSVTKSYALPVGFQKTPVVSNLNQPTAFAQTTDGTKTFILEKTGTLKIFQNGTTTVALTLPVTASGEAGLLGIALDPSFSKNNTLYLYYVNNSPYEIRLSRFTYDTNTNTIPASSEHIILHSLVPSSNVLHFSGTVRFDPKDPTILWVSVGNNAVNSNSQDLSNLFGKILRIRTDGSIPPDNPFVNRSGLRGEIWAYGFRNPYRFNFLTDGRPIVGDVGEATTEEVDIVEKGGNYGWPTCEGPCTSTSYVNPIFSYPHNGGSAAVVGGVLYQGSNFPAAYQGDAFFYGDYANNFIHYLKLAGDGSFISDNDFDNSAGDVVYMDQGFDGNLYFIDITNPQFSPNSGALYKVTYSTQALPPTAQITATPQGGETGGTIGGLAPLQVSFSSTGSSDPSNHPLTYKWDFGDGGTDTTANPTHTYTQNGTYVAILTVNNGTADSQKASVTVKVGVRPPSVTMTSPAINTTYNAGQTITYSATATDPQDGTLPDSDYSWTVIFHHQTHIHPFLGPLQGKSGSFSIPDHDFESSPVTWFEIDLTVTDSQGLQTTISRLINPNEVTLTFNAASASGQQILVDGIPYTTPYTTKAVVGYKRGLDVITPQTIHNTNYDFKSWSDNGAKSHQITTPNVDTTYTATFSQVASGNGSVHYRVREFDANGNWDGKFINGATAKLTDPSGTTVYATTTSRNDPQGNGGWVFFDNVPAGTNYGIVTYEPNYTGVWKQTDCGGTGTGQNATIQNSTSQSLTAGFQEPVTVQANQTTWCQDVGLHSTPAGNLFFRVLLINKNPQDPHGYTVGDGINGVTVKLTDTSGSNVAQTATSSASPTGENGWVFLRNVTGGTYGAMAYKPGYTGYWKQVDCIGTQATNATIQNGTTENQIAAWNNSVPIVGGTTTYCYDLGLISTGAVFYRVREFDATGNWDGKFINGATAKLTDSTGTQVIATGTSGKNPTGEDGWVLFDHVQAGVNYGTLTYEPGFAGVWKQNACDGTGTKQNVTIQNGNTDGQTAVIQTPLSVLPNQATWCSDIGLQNTTVKPVGSIHYRVREFDSTNNWDGKFINGATAKLTDSTGTQVIATATSQKDPQGNDGWVFFDNVPVASSDGVLTYDVNHTGFWKQTSCQGVGTTQNATIQNTNTGSNIAAFQTPVAITANQTTWCEDIGLKVKTPDPVPSPRPGPTVTDTPSPAPSPRGGAVTTQTASSSAVETESAKQSPAASQSAQIKNSILFFGDDISDIANPPSSESTYADALTKKLTLLRLNQTPNDASRAAIAKSLLIDTESTASASFIKRAGLFNPETLVIAYGMNDYQLMGTTNKQRQIYDLTTWKNAWETVYKQINALPQKPKKIYILSMPLMTKAPKLSGKLPSWAKTTKDLTDQMNSITKQEAEKYGASFVDITTGMSEKMIDSSRQTYLTQDGQTFVANMLLKAMGYQMPEAGLPRLLPDPFASQSASPSATPNPLPTQKPASPTPSRASDPTPLPSQTPSPLPPSRSVESSKSASESASKK